MVSPAHLALVRSLKLVWDDQGWASAPEFDTPTLRAAWPSLCDALATQFSGLESLYVALGMPSNEASVEALYLDELRKVRQVRRNFKVCIPMGFLTRFYGGCNTSVAESDDMDDDEHEEHHHEEPLFELCRHTAGEVCQMRREVIAAEWLGESRPSTPGLKELVRHVPTDVHPWADGEWHDVDDGKGGDWIDAVIAGSKL